MKCNFCNREHKSTLSFKNLFSYYKEDYCLSCKEKLSLKIYKHNKYNLFYLSDYSFLKDSIYSIKYFGDIKQAEKFKIIINNFLKNKKYDLILIAPTNKTREAIRGFNHIKIIADICQIDYLDIFTEGYRQKQSKLHSQRKLHKIFIEKNSFPIIESSERILIFDDIFTSGKTLESLANALLEIKKDLDINFFCLAKS